MGGDAGGGGGGPVAGAGAGAGGEVRGRAAAAEAAAATVAAAYADDEVEGGLVQVHLGPVLVRYDPSFSATEWAIYDDGSKSLLTCCRGVVTPHPLPWSDGERTAGVRPGGDGPGVDIAAGAGGGGELVQAARLSPDCEVLAVLLAGGRIDLYATAGGRRGSREGGAERGRVLGSARCRAGDRPLGLLWARIMSRELVVVTSGGLEVIAVPAGGGEPAGVEARRVSGGPAEWHVHSHDTGLVLFGAPAWGARVRGFQIAGGGQGILKLPSFEVASGAGRSPPGPSTLTPLSIYGRLYCAYSAGDGTVLVYRYYKDAVVLQHELATYSPRVSLSCCDNLIVAHSLATGVAMVFDIVMGTAHPIASPLPLGPARSGGAPAGAGGDGGGSGSGSGGGGGGGGWVAYRGTWLYMSPDVVLDPDAGVLRRVHVDLGALAASCSERVALVGFLQRRLGPGARELTLDVLRHMVYEREPLAELGRAFDVLCTAHAHAARLRRAARGARPGSSGGLGPLHEEARAGTAAPPVVGPAEVLREVLARGEEMAADSGYLRAATAELARAAEAAGGAPPPPALYAFEAELLSREGKYYQVAQRLSLGVAPPTDAAALSEALEPFLPPAPEGGGAQWGWGRVRWDVRARGGGAAGREAEVRELLAAGRVAAALRHARAHAVAAVDPGEFLDAAIKAGPGGGRDGPLYATVLRFCQEQARATSHTSS